MKKQKGITLIALVITIIIMLILVAVTVSYGIKSGLLSKAKDATSSYTYQEEEDEIVQIRLSYLADKESKEITEELETRLQSELTGEANVEISGEYIVVTYNETQNQHEIKIEKEEEESTANYYVAQNGMGTGKDMVFEINKKHFYGYKVDSNQKKYQKLLESEIVVFKNIDDLTKSENGLVDRDKESVLSNMETNSNGEEYEVIEYYLFKDIKEVGALVKVENEKKLYGYGTLGKFLSQDNSYYTDVLSKCTETTNEI